MRQLGKGRFLVGRRTQGGSAAHVFHLTRIQDRP
jgi:hypothetical protein